MIRGLGIFAVLVIVVGMAANQAQPRVFAIPIFASAQVTWMKKPFFGDAVQQQEVQLQAGSAFLLDQGKDRDPVLITARHCIDFPVKDSDAALAPNCKVKPSSVTRLVTGLALAVNDDSVHCHPDPKADFAVLYLTKEQVRLIDADLAPARFPKGQPKVNTRVSVWGYPIALVVNGLETVGAQTSISLEITEVKADGVIVARRVDGQVMEAGFSGGPMIDKDNNVVGVITSMDSKKNRDICYGRSIELFDDANRNNAAAPEGAAVRNSKK